MARVVVIEDDRGVRELIGTVLGRAGHEVIIATDAEDGVGLVHRELAASDERLIVITDIFMPDRDGLELTSELKKAYPNLPVIAISGGGSEGDRGYLVAARAFGADFTLPKPFRPRELRAAVDELLGGGE